MAARILTTAAWVLCSITAVALFFAYVEGPRGSANFLPDLSVYWHSVRGFHSYDRLYNCTRLRQYPFTYPPFAGVLLSPIGQVPFPLLTVIWSVLILLGAFVFSLFIAPWIALYLESHWRPELWRRTPVLPLVTILTLVSGPVLSNLSSGQISLFIVLLTLVDVSRLAPPRFQGIALGVAAAIKLTPLAFVPYLWLTNRRRAAIVSMCTFVLCTGIGWLLAAHDSNLYWGTLIWQTDRADPHHSLMNLSVTGMLSILDLTGSLQKAIWIGLAMVVGSIAYVRARRADMDGNPMVGVAIVGAMSVCVSPLSWEHHAVWLLVALVASPSRTPSGWISWLVIIFVVVSGLRPWTMAAMALTQSSRLGLVLFVMLIKAQGLLALAVACFAPLRCVVRAAPSSGSATDYMTPGAG